MKNINVIKVDQEFEVSIYFITRNFSEIINLAFFAKKIEYVI